MGNEEPISRVVDGSVWDDFCDRLRSAGRQIIENSPDDAFDRAEGLRYLCRLTSTFLQTATRDAAPPVTALLPMALKVGLDNPDYVYFNASLDSRFEYRLWGDLGDAHTVGFGTFSGGLGSKQGLIRDGYLESSQLEVDPDGQFEIRLSRQPSEGNWLSMGNGTNALQVRQTLLERADQRAGAMQLQCLHPVEPSLPLDPADFAGSLDRAGGMILGTLTQFLGWTANFASHPHEIHPLDPKLMSLAQGDPNTRYHYGYWDLDEEEVFVVEFTPPECDYWNLQIGNHWLESLDFMHRRTHVNHHTAVRRADGSVRIAIARRDPGVANWLDTAGHARGALALRWVGAKQAPEVVTRLLARSELA